MPYVPPTFGGIYMFGNAQSQKGPQINPVDHQQTAVVGLDGVREMRLGERGGYTTIEGRLFGATPAALASAVSTLRYAHRMGYSILTDRFGQAWPFVRMDVFEEVGRDAWDPGGLGYSVRYTARFFHAYLP